MQTIKVFNDCLLELKGAYHPIGDIRKFGIRKGNVEITFSQEVVVIPAEEYELPLIQKELIDIVAGYYSMLSTRYSKTRG